MILGIAHMGIAANDPKGLTNWYCKNLNMEVVRNINDNVFFVYDRKGVYLEIYPAKSDKDASFDNYTKGIRHLAILVEDFESEYERLTKIGIKPAAEVVVRDTFKLGLFYDCENNLFHIVERFDKVEF